MNRLTLVSGAFLDVASTPATASTATTTATTLTAFTFSSRHGVWKHPWCGRRFLFGFFIVIVFRGCACTGRSFRCDGSILDVSVLSDAATTAATAATTTTAAALALFALRTFFTNDDRIDLTLALNFGRERLVVGFFFFGDGGDANWRTCLLLRGRFFCEFAQLQRLLGSGQRSLTFGAATTTFALSLRRHGCRYHLGKHVIFGVIDIENSDTRGIAGVVRGVLNFD